MKTKQEVWAVMAVPKTFNQRPFEATVSTHGTEDGAISEARRQAKNHSDIEYTVLRSVRSFIVEPLTPVEYEHGDYPF